MPKSSLWGGGWVQHPMLCAAGPQAGDEDLSPQPCRRRQTGSWLEADSCPLRWQEGLRPPDASRPVERGQQPAVQGTEREQTPCHPASGLVAASEAWGQPPLLLQAPAAAEPGQGDIALRTLSRLQALTSASA